VKEKKRYGRDTKTRWESIYARHQVGCRVEGLPKNPTLREIARACNCDPAYWGRVYDRDLARYKKTKFCATTAAARSARKVLATAIERGGAPGKSIKLRDAHARMVKDANEGRFRNKWGKRYKTKALVTLDGALEKHIVSKLGHKDVDQIRTRHIELIVEDLSTRLSGSRVRGIVNSVHSLFRWAKKNEFATEDPAAGVELPALNYETSDRIATPSEFVKLLNALKPADALPYALAGYAWGRRSQVLHLLWEDVDLKVGILEWGVEEDGARKSEAAHHVVPLLRPLWQLLKEAWIEQGRPDGKCRVCPPRNKTKSGLLSEGGLADRATKAWEDAGLERIRLQDCRHSAATWLDAARISPKTASVLMSHTVPDPQPGAAPITLRTYTHLMPEALEEARKEMDAWLVARLEKERGGLIVVGG
jgi:integrase